MTPTILTSYAGKPDDPFADFRNFLWYLFVKVRGWKVIGEVQYDVADFMQHLPRHEDGIARGLVMGMRGLGKTEVAVAFALWLLYHNPDIKILVISSVDEKAKAFMQLAREIIDYTPLLDHMKPQLARDGLVSKDQKDNLHGFVIGTVTKPSKEMSIASYAIFGTFTGSHPDVILSDDIETPENALTAKKREKLKQKRREYESLINPGGLILDLGTPQSEDSIYNTLDVAKRRWPSRAPALSDEVACENVSPLILQKVACGDLKPGQPTYPERFGELQLMEKLAQYGPTMYELQMQLNTKLADADRYPLKLRNLIVMDVNVEFAPERVVWGTGIKHDDLDPQGMPGDYFYAPAATASKYDKYQDGIMHIDPKGRGADSVGYSVVKALNGFLYEIETGGVAAGKGNDGASEAIMEKLAKVALRCDVKRVQVEDNFGDGMYTKLLTPVMGRINGPTEVKDVKSRGQKELRILDVLEPLTTQHRLVMSKRSCKNDRLMYQFTRITKDRGSLQHEDELEALAAACQALGSLVMVDPEKKVIEANNREMSKMVEDFRQNSWGFKSLPAVKPWTSRGTGRWKHRTKASNR